MHAVENTGHREHRDNYCRFNVSILQLQKALTIEGKSKLWAVVYATGYRQNITPSQCLILETRITELHFQEMYLEILIVREEASDSTTLLVLCFANHVFSMSIDQTSRHTFVIVEFL